MFGMSEKLFTNHVYMCLPTQDAGQAGRRGGLVRVVLSAAGNLVERLVCNRLSEAIQASASAI